MLPSFFTLLPDGVLEMFLITFLQIGQFNVAPGGQLGGSVNVLRHVLQVIVLLVAIGAELEG